MSEIVLVITARIRVLFTQCMGAKQSSTKVEAAHSFSAFNIFANVLDERCAAHGLGEA